MEIINFLNDNQGILTAIGLFLAIPFSIWAGRIIESSQNKNNNKEIEKMLIHELWINLNYVSQIENTYEKNLIDKRYIHMPHYPPRTEVIEKIVEFRTLPDL